MLEPVLGGHLYDVVCDAVFLSPLLRWCVRDRFRNTVLDSLRAMLRGYVSILRCLTVLMSQFCTISMPRLFASSRIISLSHATLLLDTPAY